MSRLLSISICLICTANTLGKLSNAYHSFRIIIHFRTSFLSQGFSAGYFFLITQVYNALYLGA